ncbi:MAG: AAA family ATPase [Candidatus Moraniibacteriota bacterium]
MYLKKLELNGFKSFANKTALDFLPSFPEASQGKYDPALVGPRGITAIVGPNGSGKSNIADAIRWAIGEQSLKNLRGKKSEDVIFAGTDKKTRLGSASVTLSFDNADKRLPIEFAEVAITRKIYRNGESEYLVNGSRVRLMDVVDLLAKAGIGRDSYCVITQGMSDALLQATPAERRTIFEDAAGVKQYQVEKERSLRKLESTKENLARVDSLVLEIEPHLKNLKRQAEKASQGKEIAKKLRDKQLLLYGYLWHSFQDERGALVSYRDSVEKALRALEEETMTLQKEASSASLAMQTNEREDEMERELQKLREELNVAVREMSVLEGRREIELEKQREREEIRVIPVDLVFVQARLEDLGKLQKELIEKLAHVERLEDLQDIREFATVIRQRLADLRAQAGEGSVREKKVVALPDTEREVSEKRLREVEEELTRLKKQVLEWEGLLVKKSEALTGIREASKTYRETFFTKENLAREKERELSTKKDELNERKVALARIEVREEDLTALVREELAMESQALVYDGTSVERERVEREIARLKVEVEHVGTIDPLIVEEYEETEKRYTFLTTESADLRKAIESLKHVVKEMDEKIDHAFHDAFGEIQKKFSEYFKVIFGGGKAELNIVKIKTRKRGATESEDEEDLDATEVETTPEAFEIGIEIVASPPGKRIHNMAMLSGGERSLTSLALLFAIISHNPPPFAVLDEVEAALDEANSRRFGRMLQELSSHTQFVAITHNRETMLQAGLLYGVTMNDEGVSHLLSVRLDQVGENGKLKPHG